MKSSNVFFLEVNLPPSHHFCPLSLPPRAWHKAKKTSLLKCSNQISTLAPGEGKWLTYWVLSLNCLYTPTHICIGPMEPRIGEKLLLGYPSKSTTAEKKMLIFYMIFFHAKLKILEIWKCWKNINLKIYVEFF